MHQTAIFTEGGELYLIDHKNCSDPTTYTIINSNVKNIIQLESSFSHFLALKWYIRPGIQDWDTGMV